MTTLHWLLKRKKSELVEYITRLESAQTQPSSTTPRRSSKRWAVGTVRRLTMNFLKRLATCVPTAGRC